VADDSSWPALDSLLGDRYTREARIAPAFLCVFPILILLMAWFKGLQSAVPALLSLLCVFGVVRWISHIARGIGDDIEIELFSEWGGKPTTTMLRVALKRVQLEQIQLFNADSTGKGKGSGAGFRRRARFFLKVQNLLRESPHGDKMKELIASRNGPTFPEEREDKKIAECDEAYAVQAYLLDSLYEPVVAWMRENSRDNKLVFEEEISYGFQRNFYALKRFALCCNGAAFLVQVGVIAGVYHWRHHAWAMAPSLAAVILAANLLYLAGVLKFVSRDDVMVQGFIYARQLFDALYAAHAPSTKDDSEEHPARAAAKGRGKG